MLECYSCASKNVFGLGFVPVKIENSAVLLCRDHKAHDPGLQELDLDLTSWQPLIEDRAFVPWLVTVPTEKVIQSIVCLLMDHLVQISEYLYTEKVILPRPPQSLSKSVKPKACWQAAFL